MQKHFINICSPIQPPHISGWRLTKLVLQQPDLQLDEAVSIETLVFPPAAVADFMATEIQLALRIQGSDFGISDCALLKNVDQTPTNRKTRSHLSYSPLLSKLEIKDSLVKLKVVFGDCMRAK